MAVSKTSLEKAVCKLTGTYQAWEIWADWIYMLAAALSQPLDFRENREKRYIDIASKYTAEELQIFQELSNIVIAELERDPEQDLLGNTYMRLELGNHWTGQFFTPYHLCACMAQLQCAECLRIISENGYVTVNDPACGGGATLVAAVNEIKRRMHLADSPLNHQDHILVIAQDLSEITALMCYVQMALLGIAAIIKVGDSLADPITGDYLNMPRNDNLWFTPMYNMPVWSGRQIAHKLDLALASSKSQAAKHTRAIDLSFDELF